MKKININIFVICVLIVISLLLSSCAVSKSRGENNNSVKKSSSYTSASTASESSVQPTTIGETKSVSPTTAKLNNAKKNKKDILLIGHRGYTGQYPESTLEGFTGAFRSGFDGIECDVWETKTGALLIQHDPTTTRTTGKKNYIWRLSVKKRGDYPIIKGDNVSRYNSQKLTIPTLTEVLKVVRKNNGYLWLHIKNNSKYKLSKKGEKKIMFESIFTESSTANLSIRRCYNMYGSSTNIRRNNSIYT